MWPFNKKTKRETDASDLLVDTKIQVLLHKDAVHSEITKANDAVKRINQILDENGFTFKIYLAAGGFSPPTRNRKTIK